MYVPSLVEQIHNGKTGAINLKGFAVGNGIIGHADTFPGMNSIHYEMLHSASYHIVFPAGHGTALRCTADLMD